MPNGTYAMLSYGNLIWPDLELGLCLDQAWASYLYGTFVVPSSVSLSPGWFSNKLYLKQHQICWEFVSFLFFGNFYLPFIRDCTEWISLKRMSVISNSSGRYCRNKGVGHSHRRCPSIFFADMKPWKTRGKCPKQNRATPFKGGGGSATLYHSLPCLFHWISSLNLRKSPNDQRGILTHFKVIYKWTYLQNKNPKLVLETSFRKAKHSMV